MLWQYLWLVPGLVSPRQVDGLPGQLERGQEPSSRTRRDVANTWSAVGCQINPTRGRDYEGTANTTVSGRSCQAWAAKEPYVSSYPEVGDHNYCRNPNGNHAGVWCYTALQLSFYWEEYLRNLNYFLNKRKEIEFSL